MYNMINQTLALHKTVWRVSAKSVGSDVFGNIHAGSRERCCSPSGCTEMAGPRSFKINESKFIGCQLAQGQIEVIFWTALLPLFSLILFLSYSSWHLSEIGDAQWSHNESISCFGTWLSTNVERSLGAPVAQKTENSQLWGKAVREILPWNLESCWVWVCFGDFQSLVEKKTCCPGPLQVTNDSQ